MTIAGAKVVEWIKHDVIVKRATERVLLFVSSPNFGYQSTSHSGVPLIVLNVDRKIMCNSYDVILI